MKYLNIDHNFLGLEEKYSSFENSEIVILPAPLEKTVSYGQGTSLGPVKLMEASQYVEFFDEETFKEICFDKGICTVEPLEFGPLKIEESLELLYSTVKQLMKSGKFVATLGGEHSLSIAPIKAHLENFENVSILQIDAHSDFRDEYEGSKHSHASVMARAAELTKDIIQVGIRAQCKEESDFILQNDIATFYARDLRSKYLYKNWQNEVVKNLNDNVYITFDIDGFDPALVPATGTPEPGGLFWDETMNLLKQVGADKNIIGFDVVELAPIANMPSSDFVAAKLVYKLLNYSLG
jgi:agmatinase